MSSNKFGFGCLTTIGVVATLFFGGRYLSRQFIGQELTPIDAAEVISDEALFATFIETDLDEWSQIKELGNAQTQRIIEEQLTEIKADINREEDFNYPQDIQPWLDGAMFAYLPGDTAFSEPEMLVVLGIKNKLKALNFLKKIEADTELIESKYKGVKITETIDSKNYTTISALLGNRLILAEERDTIEQAIDTYKGETSLADTPEIFQQKLNDGNALVRVYLPNYGDFITRAIAEDLNKSVMSTELMATLNSIDSVAAGFSVEERGLRLQTITKFDSGEFVFDAPHNKSKILKRLPENTIVSINGRGISLFWEQMVAQLQKDRETKRYFNLAKLVTRRGLNLDLESEIFNWMDGEFAVGIVTSSTPLYPQLDIGLGAGIIIETSQPKEAKKALEQLEKGLQKYLARYPRQNKINKKEVTQWSIPDVPGSLSYGWLDKNHLLLAWDETTYAAIDRSRKKSVAKNNSFQKITQEMPNKNSGYLYIDVAQIMDEVEKLSIPQNNSQLSNAIAIINSIEAIGSTTTMPDKNTSQGDLFILFKDK